MTDDTNQTISSDKHFCAHCGTENAMGDYACTRCGERLVEVTSETESPLGLSSCARCGSANNTRAEYCWVCGSEMRDAVRIAPKPTAPLEEVQVPSAAQPRTYRPDLNPVSTPTTKPTTPETSEVDELRGSSVRPNPGETFATGSPTETRYESDDVAFENTSGTRDGEVPPEIKRWNWGAFLMPAVWGLFSGVPIAAALLAAVFLPVPFGQLVLLIGAFYLGARGNEHAWRGKKWRSVEHFNAFQKQWATWAVRITIAFVAIAVIYALSFSGS